MPSEKQKKEKVAWNIAEPFIQTSNPAEYMAARREVAKLSQNPQFFSGLQELRRQQEQGFVDFLKNSNMGPYPKLVKFLNTDMTEFFKPKRRRR